MNEIQSLSEGIHAIFARITNLPTVRTTSKMPVTIAEIGDESHRIQLTWFRMPYLRSTLIPGKQYIFFGKLVSKKGRWTMEQPVIYTPEEYMVMEGKYRAVYGLTAGITNNLIVKTLQKILDSTISFHDFLPDELRQEYELCELNYAYKQIHVPDDMDALVVARKRFVFEEFFVFILGLQYQKSKRVAEPNRYDFCDSACMEEWIANLPYPLTGAQKRTLKEIVADLTGESVSQRLIQGDVGSGKTVVAFLAMAWVSVSGYQSAIMAPTEVLAKQHYETFTALCESLHIENRKIILLTGSMTAKQKRMAYEAIEVYPDAMIIGTQALIQEKLSYSNLALVVTDEQHRFGVKQRDQFSDKGWSPHVLIMSATPIPRTLAIILYGDMSISVMDEVPAKRLPIKNKVVRTGERPKAYQFILKQIEKGHQAYIICPLVEETEQCEGEDVIQYSQKIREFFPESCKIGVLHGKMKGSLKNEVMEMFAKNELQILISTTVIEVGVNVPNATVMMIENAERFGLAQLHQLRGRVGRGDAQSYCIMVNSSEAQTAQKRLDILNRSNDGFFIASEDLKLRGPGDLFGIRQSGDMVFQLADIYQDSEVMIQASAAVSKILDEDPLLQKPEHEKLERRMRQFLSDQFANLTL